MTIENLSGTMLVEFDVRGTPVAQPRARHARIGNSIRSYYPAKHPIGAWKNMAILSIQEALGNAKQKSIGDIPILVIAEFVFPRPKASKIVEKITKPDIDNLGKALMDAITASGFWRDDGLVSQTILSKRNTRDGEMPHTKVGIYALTPTIVSRGKGRHS